MKRYTVSFLFLGHAADVTVEMSDCEVPFYTKEFYFPVFNSYFLMFTSS